MARWLGFVQPAGADPNPTAAKSDPDQELAAAKLHRAIFSRDGASPDGKDFQSGDGIEPSC